ARACTSAAPTSTAADEPAPARAPRRARGRGPFLPRPEESVMRASRLPAAWLALAAPALAWAAPGEDPVVLTQKQNVNMLPTAPAPRSSDAVLTDGMPSWLRARVVRFESKAMGNPAGMRTD